MPLITVKAKSGRTIEQKRGLVKDITEAVVKNFKVESERLTRKKKGKREYLSGAKTRELIRELYGVFECMVEVPRIRIGRRQTVETLIKEEALLLAKFLRKERKTWMPRIAVP